jgi:hypothetical protein
MKASVPQLVVDELEASGLPWHVEAGGRHYKLVVADRLAGILPYSGKAQRQECAQRAVLNMRAQVRRVIREAKG